MTTVVVSVILPVLSLGSDCYFFIDKSRCSSRTEHVLRIMVIYLYIYYVFNVKLKNVLRRRCCLCCAILGRILCVAFVVFLSSPVCESSPKLRGELEQHATPPYPPPPLPTYFFRFPHLCLFESMGPYLRPKTIFSLSPTPTKCENYSS